jgi:hypothetical protein
VQFPAGEGNLFGLRSLWACSGADHCHSSHPEVRGEGSAICVLSYVFMLYTEMTLLPTSMTFCEILASVISMDF